MHSLDRAWDELKREFDLASSNEARAARHQVTNELNQVLRRLRQYENEGEWFSALLDGASCFAPSVAVFELKNGSLLLRRQNNLELQADLMFPASSAAGFADAIETKDPVVALRSASQVGESLSASGTNERVHLLPVINGGRVVAVLFVSGGELVDVNGLELVTGLASIVLERQNNRAIHSQIEPLREPMKAEQTEPKATGGGPARTMPAWSALDKQGQNLHIRAQRFSRVKVAEMQMSRPEACQAGREKGNLYLFLKGEIETARDQFRQQFMIIPSMVDYLHLELVQTAAEGDEARLGADYPGQLL